MYQMFLADDDDKSVKNISKSMDFQFNRSMVEIVKHLEAKGLKQRYGIKHLNLWATLTADGVLVRSSEKHNWQNYLIKIGGAVLRKGKNEKPTSLTLTVAGSLSENVKSTLMQNNQLLQAFLLALLSQRLTPSNTYGSIQGSPFNSGHSGSDFLLICSTYF